MEGEKRLRIAVAGSGVSGLTTAYLLSRKHDVTLFEKNGYFGGHTHTLTIEDGPDKGTPVDTGFIVMNHRNYPLLTKLFAELEVTLRDSNMSFSYYDERSGLQYSGSGINGLFAQRLNLFRPAFRRMIRETMRFYREAAEALHDGTLDALSLGDYLARGGYSTVFVDQHILPMGSAIWSTPSAEMLEFPAAAFVRFFENHGLLRLSDRPQWRTVVGGSQQYVKRMFATMKVDARSNCPVQRVTRTKDGVTILSDGGREDTFDCIVIAAHADQALGMLRDPSDEEKRLLGVWRYEKNKVVLHSDRSAMPPLKRVWSSWNYTQEKSHEASAPASVTYWMNLLQGLETERPYFVTLNRKQPIAEDRIVAEMVYDHPTYGAESMAVQKELPGLSGQRNTYYCGSYFGYGFHEDAVRSAVGVAKHFGIELRMHASTSVRSYPTGSRRFHTTSPTRCTPTASIWTNSRRSIAA